MHHGKSYFQFQLLTVDIDIFLQAHADWIIILGIVNDILDSLQKHEDKIGEVVL